MTPDAVQTQAVVATAHALTGGDPSAAPKIVASGVECTFGTGSRSVHALGPLDVTVREGEVLCIVGPSGCGKSTFLRLVAGLRPPSAGRIELYMKGDTLAPIATVFQDYGIFPWKTVEANVAFGVRVAGAGRAEAKDRARHWLRRLGLIDFADAYPTTLSGGMRQRVAIARALAVEPEIILMDEPFAALDAQLREILQDDLLRICEETKRTVVFVTHSLEEALILGDKVMVMSARPGRMLTETHVPFEHPRDSSVRESAEFGQLRAHLWEHLRLEVNAQLASSTGGA